MDILQVTLRFIHVICGAFWVGVILFNAIFLGPAVRATGPDGGKVMGALIQRKLTTVMPIIGLAAILSGIWLYYRASLGFQSAYMRSATGMTFAFGGTCAILALAIGGAVLAPSMLKMAAAGQAMAQASPADRERLQAELQKLRARAGMAGNIVAVFGFLALAAMSVARYV